MTYSPRFRACLAETLRWEGGWSDHPRDIGGPTHRGVTIYRYAAHMGYAKPERGTPEWERIKAELRRLPDAVLVDIYHRWYWQPIRGDDLPPLIDVIVFDFAVNSGHPRAIRHLQNVLGVTVDGDIGPATLNAARDADRAELVFRYLDARRAYLRQCRDFDVFGRGWLNRVDGIEDAVLAAVRAEITASRQPGQPPPIPVWDTTVAAPIPDPDAQSATQGRAVVAETTSMSGSTTGRASELIGAGGSANVGVEVAAAASRSRLPGGSFDALGFALALAQSPTFWISVGLVVSAAYVWLERRRKTIVL